MLYFITLVLNVFVGLILFAAVISLLGCIMEILAEWSWRYKNKKLQAIIILVSALFLLSVAISGLGYMIYNIDHGKWLISLPPAQTVVLPEKQ
jgi:hypothetical protein